MSTAARSPLRSAAEDLTLACYYRIRALRVRVALTAHRLVCIRTGHRWRIARPIDAGLAARTGLARVCWRCGRAQRLDDGHRP